MEATLPLLRRVYAEQLKHTSEVLAGQSIDVAEGDYPGLDEEDLDTLRSALLLTKELTEAFFYYEDGLEDFETLLRDIAGWDLDALCPTLREEANRILRHRYR